MTTEMCYSAIVKFTTSTGYTKELEMQSRDDDGIIKSIEDQVKGLIDANRNNTVTILSKTTNDKVLIGKGHLASATITQQKTVGVFTIQWYEYSLWEHLAIAIGIKSYKKNEILLKFQIKGTNHVE